MENLKLYEEFGFEPSDKIYHRLKDNTDMDVSDIEEFVSSITSQELEDKVFALFTGHSNSSEQKEMYDRIEREIDMAGYDASNLE